jgi:UDP-GlcNAc:undecaprenyl-phosphate GlcNAc-1-phosphate transferase
VRLGAFLFFGVYRGIWRYTGMDDLLAFGKAVAAGSIVSMLIILFKFRFQGFSRAIFLIDGLVMLLLLAGSRVAFSKVFSSWAFSFLSCDPFPLPLA